MSDDKKPDSSFSDMLVSKAKSSEQQLTQWQKQFNTYLGESKSQAIEYLNQGLKQSANLKIQAMKTFEDNKAVALGIWGSATYGASLEWSKFREMYKKEFLRTDNEKMRQQAVMWATIGVCIASFALLKKGYFRFTIRNTSLAWLACSLILCPENINPF